MCVVCVWCVCARARACVFRLVFPYMILRCINVLMIIITISICYITAEFILKINIVLISFQNFSMQSTLFQFVIFVVVDVY